MLQAYFVIVGIATVFCLVNWRWGLYACILVDILRDPVRKLVEEQPVLVTLVGLLPWAGAFLGCMVRDRHSFSELWRRYPAARTMVVCLLTAVAPAAMLSCILYRNGWMLAGIGCVSFIVPLVGIVMGFAFARNETSVYRLLRFYAVINGLTLVGVLFEKLQMDVPALGGINMLWVRYHEDYTVSLISGFYRSPDVMGSHAAHVFMFSVILATRAKGFRRTGWISVACWAMLALLLCGRRKMIGMPIAFACAYLLLCRARGVSRGYVGVMAVACMAIVGAAGGLFLLSDADHGEEYTDYAMSMFTEGHERVEQGVLSGAINTLQQVGMLGGGLGSATQGRYYLGSAVRAQRAWQEDGISRLFMELGVPGVLLMIVAALQFVSCERSAVLMVPPWHSIQMLQIGLLSAITANGATYVISHQQFSGDPVSSLFVTVMAGLVLSGPRLFAVERIRESQIAQRAAAPRLFESAGWQSRGAS